MANGCNHSWNWRIWRLKQHCWRILVIRISHHLLWRLWLKTINLTLVEGNPLSFYFLSFDFVLFLFCCVFQDKCLTFKFGGTFSNVTLEVFYPLGIVFLATLGTMYYLSLGVGKTLLSVSFYLLLFVFISIKKWIVLCCC